MRPIAASAAGTRPRLHRFTLSAPTVSMPSVLCWRLQRNCHPSSVIAASAFSNQYVIPISRYIVVAVVRCSCACSRLPVHQWICPGRGG